MKWIFAALLATSSCLAFASDCVKFTDEDYCNVWKNKDGDVKTIEFLRKDQSLESWDKMITAKLYSDKSALKQVLPGYVKSVKSMFAIKPEILSPPNSQHEEEVFILMVLLAPDKSHYEYVINRFYRDANTVSSVFYSHKLPFAKNVDFTDIMENKNSWLEQLQQIKIESYFGA
ncbi:hypothetical protein [Colwellia sp. 12G3]|uniref:hypothetical protein n=1 Tax=Colwellia sp. 12G3 TaxID=2058299 RepID=UPI000C32B418|nr:hypothetical protein [Colwellia sp. 12G3]PKI16307.1 hypothetical protein CXF71_10000 [Colwellia sp. 12G3]